MPARTSSPESSKRYHREREDEVDYHRSGRERDRRERERERDRDRDRRNRDRYRRRSSHSSALRSPPARNDRNDRNERDQKPTEKPAESTPQKEKTEDRKKRMEAFLAARKAAKAKESPAPSQSQSPATPAAPSNNQSAKQKPISLGLKAFSNRNITTKAATMDYDEESNSLAMHTLPPVQSSIPTNSIGGDIESTEDQSDKMAVDEPSEQPQKEEEEEEDPLDAFMSGVKEEVTRVNESDKKRMGTKPNTVTAARLDDDDDDEEEEQKEEDVSKMSAEDILALAASRVKRKEVAVTDHSKVDYEPFRKSFYNPPSEIQNLSEEDAENQRLLLDGIKIRGIDCPKPVTKWSLLGLPSSCLEVIKYLQYDQPSSIQAQALPAIMSGRDVIGVAKTGSGKTIAFLLPLFRHIKDQRPLENLEGPIGVIMTPTRELAVQIHRECKPFLKALGLRAIAAYGGSPISEQIAEMKKGAEIVVCTPGRMIDLLAANSGRVTNLRRTTYLVLDEADRMFDMGFEPQVMKIINNVRPDRQTVLFSATFPKQMESLARKILQKPLEITVGGRSVVAPEIDQQVEVREESSKFNRLLEILGQTYNEDDEARTLIFVDRQEAADNLLFNLRIKGYVAMSLHGGKDQVDRDQAITDFKNGVIPIVIATSVAARGLDVKLLKLVLNYDAPNHLEDYVHRAGRTGRAGNKGTCITFITPEQDKYSVDIEKALTASGASVPSELKAMSEAFLQKVKEGKATVAGSGFGGKGLDRFEKERQDLEKAQRSAYGEDEEVKKDGAASAATNEKVSKETEDMFGEIKIQKGPAPADYKPLNLGASTDSSDIKPENATSAVAKAAAVAAKLSMQRGATVSATLGGPIKNKDPDATDYHAIIPINDYHQRARWKITNKETIVYLNETTGCSITNKGIYYEPGKEPSLADQPKLHLLVESNEIERVEKAVRSIKFILIEATQAALEFDAKNQTTGRYSVL
ncbi:P-loop containing nucleoside triphosphate hydrolase protein [Wallemia mellicola]|uniref:RNA helicase n=1 Tax=Wallemia mellicola TaxID=1708541 RepID=A0A4T0TSZ5_9BASI|nr:P-loop containing nucleoside triphosphate hydrolase protein [Wallemia mellicola]